MAQEFNLDTPESLRVTYTLAGIGSRFLAQVIDILIIASASILLVIAALLIAQGGDFGQTVAIILYITGSFVLLFGYFMIYEAVWNGQTPGKRAIDIRVIKASGYPITFAESAIRNIVRIVDLLPGMYGVGIICMFISPDSRRLGDYAAGTIVVREREMTSLTDISRAAAPTTAELLPQPAIGEVDPEELEWNLHAVTPDDTQLARAFLGRAPQLDAAVRQRIGDEVAARIAARIGAREPLDPVRFLTRVIYLQSLVIGR